MEVTRSLTLVPALVPMLKRDRWWVINEGVLFDAITAANQGKAPEAVMTDLLADSEVEHP